MGIHNSKGNHQLKSSTNDNNNIWQTSIPPPINKSLIINKKTNYYGWEEIYRCSHTDWLHGISGRKKKKLNLFSF